MPRKEIVRAGIGASGLRGRPGLKKDVIEALRKKKFEANVARNQKRIKQGKKARSLSEREKAKLLHTIQSPARRIRELQARATELRQRATAVEKSKTGNKRAAATYRQAARELLQRIPALKAKAK